MIFLFLREYRFNLSKKLGIPPFCIAHDSTHREIARIKPTTKEELMDIKGFGKKTFDKYGEGYLSVGQSYKELEQQNDYKQNRTST